MNTIRPFLIFSMISFLICCPGLAKEVSSLAKILPPETTQLIDHPSVIKERDCFNLTAKQLDNQQLKSQQRYLNAQQKLSCRFFTYLVDGHRVKGYIIKPKSVTEDLPVLIFNRGGHGNYGKISLKSMFYTLFPVASEGFVIIGSQYRGTNTKNSKIDDEFGGKDVNDVIMLSNIIPQITDADAKRVGMFGHSRGVMQTFLALKELPNIKAVSLGAGVFDSFQGLIERPDMERVYIKRIPNYRNNKTTELKKRSVKYWVNELPKNVPMLIVHGTADKKVDVSHSIQLDKALTKYQIPHKLVLYPDDNHGIRKHKKELIAEIAAWFKKYL